jgi:hypothetical protein
VLNTFPAGDGGGASARETLDSFRPGLGVTAGVAPAELLITGTGLRVRRRRSVAVAASVPVVPASREGRRGGEAPRG